MSQPFAFDISRARELPEGVEPQVESLSSVDPFSFYVGRVIQTVAEEPGKSQLLRDLPRYIDRENRPATSTARTGLCAAPPAS